MSRQKLLNAFKLALAAAILGYLLYKLHRQDGFERLVSQPKHWPALATAQVLVIAGFSLSFVRWFLLVRGLRLPFALGDAFRLGSLGVLLNQVSPGSIGGDVVKAVFIAREQPARRPEAVATVVIDRVVGLYAMMLVTSVGLVLAELTGEPNKYVRSLQAIVWGGALAGTVGMVVVLSGYFSHPALKRFAMRVPLVSGALMRVIEALESYQTHRTSVVAAVGLASLTHTLLIVALWLCALGLPIEAPTFVANCWIVPTALAIGAIPGLPGGLGQRELAIEALYLSAGAPAGDGTMVALAFRAMVYVLTCVGGIYYFSAKKQFDQLLSEAERDAGTPVQTGEE